MYVLALDNKIVEYNLVNANERELDLTNAAIKFFYEDISGRLYYTDGKNLAYLRYPNTGHVDVFENDKTIDDLIFIYNK
jgi:hypothetical protein